MYTIENRMPNFFVVGAPKAATTTLHAVLSQHPQVFCPSLKEPGFFADDVAPSRFEPFASRKPSNGVSYVQGSMSHHEQIAFINDIKIYRQLYRRVRSEKAIGDFSTSYLCSTGAAERIYTFNRDARIIMILREPADRALSHYKMDRATGLVSRSFSDVIDEEIQAIANPTKRAHWYIRLGLYAENVKRYIELFPRKQVKIILFEDIIQSRASVFRDIETHLDVTHNISQLDLTVNRSLQPRSQSLVMIIDKTNIRPLVRKLMPTRIIRMGQRMLYTSYTKSSTFPNQAKDLARIRNICAPDIKQLANIISRDLSTWLVA